MLCEAIPYFEPHLGLWHKFFCVKLHTNVDEMCECGSAAINKVSGSKYLPREFVEANKR